MASEPTYDAEGNLLAVTQSGATVGSYVYDALNHRVSVTSNGTTSEYLYDYAGRKVSTWTPGTATATEGRIYWDGQQIAFRAANASTYFDHQDWVGTDRIRTDPTGKTAFRRYTLPWGDGGNTSGFGQSPAGQDTADFAGLDIDVESSTEHAQFRNYSELQGRWLSPDPYSGSYDLSNPESFNLYAYVLNSPLSFVDPTGLDYCEATSTCNLDQCATTAPDPEVCQNPPPYTFYVTVAEFLPLPPVFINFPTLSYNPQPYSPVPTGLGGGGSSNAPSKPGQTTTTTISNCFSQGQSAASSQPSVTPTGQNLIDTVGGALLGLAAGYFGLPEDAPLLPLINKAASGAAVGFARRSAVHAIQKAFVFDAAYTGCLSAAGIGTVPIG